MEKITLPNTDLQVSRLIAGCMRLGGGWNKDAILDSALLREAEAFIAKALELGINFFDHADISRKRIFCLATLAWQTAASCWKAG